MFQKILVPVDGSPLADQALTEVRRLLLRQDAQLMLLRVLPPKPTGSRAADWETENRKAQEHIAGLVAQWSREGAKADSEFRLGNPADEILKFADTYGPSLIAMSTHGRQGLSRWIRGSVAERILERTAFPALMVNPAGLKRDAERPERRFRRILVPLDGSDVSASILPLVRDFARVHDSEVVLYFCAILMPSPAHLEMGRDFTAEEALPVLEPQRKKLEQAGVKVEVKTTMGYPPEEILDAAEREKADLVAMTTHGRSGLSRWLYGSVAEKVLRQCRAPLLIQRTVGFPA